MSKSKAAVRRAKRAEQKKRRRERTYTRAVKRMEPSPAHRERMRAYLRAHFPHISRARREALALRFSDAEALAPKDIKPAVEVER